MSYYITHILTEKLPLTGYKQLSFLTSTKECYPQNIFFYGYEGHTKLTEKQLSEDIAQNKIIKLVEPIIYDIEKYLWLDSNGNIWSSDDILLKENKRIEGPSGIKPASSSEQIFKSIESKIGSINKCIPI